MAVLERNTRTHGAENRRIQEATCRPSTLDALNIDAVPPGGDYDAEVERLLGLGARKLMLDPGNNGFTS